eukprot:1195702-Prorocentrum_minimum.AAC.2
MHKESAPCGRLAATAASLMHSMGMDAERVWRATRSAVAAAALDCRSLMAKETDTTGGWLAPGR